MALFLWNRVKGNSPWAQPDNRPAQSPAPMIDRHVCLVILTSGRTPTGPSCPARGREDSRAAARGQPKNRQGDKEQGAGLLAVPAHTSCLLVSLSPCLA